MWSGLYEKLPGIGLGAVFAFLRNVGRFYVKNKVNSQQREGFQEGSLGLEMNLTEPGVVTHLAIFCPSSRCLSLTLCLKQ